MSEILRQHPVISIALYLIAWAALYKISFDFEWRSRMKELRAGLKNPFHLEPHMLIDAQDLKATRALDEKFFMPEDLSSIRSQKAKTQKRDIYGRFIKSPK